jgi:outer membrane immunogenic protein
MKVHSMVAAMSVAASLVAFGTSAASAADLGGAPPYSSYKDAPYVAPALNWSGFYIGGHLGGNWGDYNITGYGDAFDNGGITRYGLDPSSFIGGVQAGFNWQVNGLVLGVEGQYSFGSGDDTRGVILPNSGDFRDDFATVSLRDTATLAARLGFAYGAWMPYVKAGVAWANVRGIAGDTDGNPPVLDVGDRTSFSGWETGWLIGGGLEYMFDRNWSLKAEYQYMDFGSFKTGNLDGDTFRHDLTNHNLMLGINYRF